MRVETYTKNEMQFIRLRSEDGAIVAEMTMGEWSNLIANPKRMSK